MTALLSTVSPQDEVAVCPQHIELHKRHLREVFERLKQNGLVINAAKCQIGQQAVDFLGHRVTAEGIQPKLAKVQAIIDIPRPINAKELKRFLGAINFYRRFIPRAAENQRILQAMISGNIKNDTTSLEWNDTTNDAFLP